MSATPPLTADDEGARTQGEKLLDLRLVLGMLSSTQIRTIVIEAEQRCLPHVVSALNDYLSQRGRGRPRHDKYAEIDAWLIVWANELFRDGKAPSAWAAITRVVKGALAALDDATRGGRRVQEIVVGNIVLRAPQQGKLQKVLGQSQNAIEQRVLARLRPNKRFPSSIQRDGRTVRFRLPDIYAHLPIYKALKPRKVSRRKPLPCRAK